MSPLRAATALALLIVVACLGRSAAPAFYTLSPLETAEARADQSGRLDPS